MTTRGPTNPCNRRWSAGNLGRASERWKADTEEVRRVLFTGVMALIAPRGQRSRGAAVGEGSSRSGSLGVDPHQQPDQQAIDVRGRGTGELCPHTPAHSIAFIGRCIARAIECSRDKIRPQLTQHTADR